VDMKKMLT